MCQCAEIKQALLKCKLKKREIQMATINPGSDVPGEKHLKLEILGISSQEDCRGARLDIVA